MTTTAQVERASRDARDCREVADLREALAVAVAALHEADNELDSIAHIDQPAPDALEEALRQQETAHAVLRRVLRAAAPERKRRLRQMMREERERHLYNYADAYLGPYPVLPEVTAALASAREQLRRLRALSPAVRDVLDEGGWE